MRLRTWVLTRTAACAWVACCITAAAAAAPPPRTQTVHFKSGSETIAGFLARPDTPGRHPALLVVHDWWGMNDWVKEQTRRLAAAGYVTLAVDLYRDSLPHTLDEAHQLSRGVPDDRALRDLQAGFAFLEAHSEVDKTKIGSLGWSMGGGYALDLAVHEPRLATCVVNYGAPPTDRASIARIQAPVLGNFGAQDRGLPPASVSAFGAAMKSAGKSADLKIYPGAGHGFDNEGIKDSYRSAAAADAWNRTLSFLARTLRGAEPRNPLSPER